MNRFKSKYNIILNNKLKIELTVRNNIPTFYYRFEWYDKYFYFTSLKTECIKKV